MTTKADGIRACELRELPRETVIQMLATCERESARHARDADEFGAAVSQMREDLKVARDIARQALAANRAAAPRLVAALAAIRDGQAQS